VVAHDGKPRAVVGRVGSEGRDHDAAARGEPLLERLEVAPAVVRVDEEVEGRAVVPEVEAPVRQPRADVLPQQANVPRPVAELRAGRGERLVAHVEYRHVAKAPLEQAGGEGRATAADVDHRAPLRDAECVEEL
jgi:hypothetical protein